MSAWMEPTDQQRVCPECGTSDVRPEDEGFYCGDCDLNFENPDRTVDSDWRGARIPTQLLVEDMHSVTEHLGRPPNTTEYDRHGKFSPKPFYTRFEGDSWDEVVESALEQEGVA